MLQRVRQYVISLFDWQCFQQCFKFILMSVLSARRKKALPYWKENMQTSQVAGALLYGR